MQKPTTSHPTLQASKYSIGRIYLKINKRPCFLPLYLDTEVFAIFFGHELFTVAKTHAAVAQARDLEDGDIRAFSSPW